MERLKIFVDTSVVSHLDADDAPDKMRETWLFFDDIKLSKYEVVVSEVVFDELNRCPEPKRQKMAEYLNKINYTRIVINDEIREIADEIIKQGILTENQRDDCLHIACAIYTKCDYLVSWNFKHLVKGKTIKGVRTVTNLLGYESIDIVSPSMLIEREE
jgi:predicted nucleic acid-binding protein